MKGKKLIYTLPIIGVVCILVGLVAGIFVGVKRGIPFVTEKEQWTIGIYSGESPFALTNELGFRNPVLKAEDVTDVPAKFVADPFLIRDDSTWYLFFEVYNLNNEQGDLAVATSKDAKNWEYQQVIIDEPFHLSYPYVFNHNGDYYLIPESYQSNSIRLYKATNFPYEWEFVSTLVEDVSLVDPSIVNINDMWWIFSSEESKENDTLRLYYADELTGPWQEHPASPIVEGDNRIARPSGRILKYDDRIYRLAMDLTPEFGTHQVVAVEITELTPTTYEEVPLDGGPLLKPDGSGWNSIAMHQLDAHQVGVNQWIASVDGFGTYLIFGLKY
jgi:hypothetical protein